jgi:light-regulated signal transduction histidine kinase (bacteriophytochrome)
MLRTQIVDKQDTRGALLSVSLTDLQIIKRDLQDLEKKTTERNRLNYHASHTVFLTFSEV